MTGAETEEDIPLGERKTVTDFCYLLDKSKQLFNGLRSVYPPQRKHLVLKDLVLGQVPRGVAALVLGRFSVIG